MSKRDYYSILGLTKKATTEEIKKAYRTLARKFHPDVNKEPGADEIFKTINEANEVLSNPVTRAEYDKKGKVEGYNAMDSFDPTGFESIFNEIFNAFTDFGVEFATNVEPETPKDIRIPIELNFYEALKGTSKTITYKRYSKCKICDGTGDSEKKEPIVCQDCNGKGYIRKEKKSAFGIQVAQGTCAKCNGKGKLINSPCGMCSGTAKRFEEISLSINIPMGLQDKEELLIPQKGNYSLMGTGDLYLDVSVSESKYFKRIGNDLYSEIWIDPLMVIIGGKQQIETPWGPVEVTIPMGIEPEQKIKIRGLGVKKLSKTPGLSKEGDLYLEVKVAKSDYVDQEVIKNLRLYINKQNRFVKYHMDEIRKEIYDYVKKQK